MRTVAVYLPEVRVRITLKKTIPAHDMEIETSFDRFVMVRPDFLWVTYFYSDKAWYLSDLVIYGYRIGEKGKPLSELINSGEYSPYNPPKVPAWMQTLLDEHTPVTPFPYGPFEDSAEDDAL